MRSDVSYFQLCYLNLTSHDFSHIDNEQAQKLKQWQAFLECVDKIFEKSQTVSTNHRSQIGQ